MTLLFAFAYNILIILLMLLLILIHVSSNVCTFPHRHLPYSLSLACPALRPLCLFGLVFQPHTTCFCFLLLFCVFIRSFSLFLLLPSFLAFCFASSAASLPALSFSLSLAPLFGLLSLLCFVFAFVPVSRERATYKAKHVKGERAKSGQRRRNVGPRRLLFALQLEA